MPFEPQMGNPRPHWTVSFTVDDVDAVARDAVRLGGTLCVPVMAIPAVGRFCGVVSPQGVVFFAIEYTK